MIKYSIPFRGRLPYDPFEVHISKQLARVGVLDNNYHKLYTHIDSIYGFLGPCALNGGRSNIDNEITIRDIEIAINNHIKVRVPLTSTIPTYESYTNKNTKEILDFLNDTDGGVVVASDKLATWIRNDYDNISIEASAIQDITTNEELKEKLKLYNTVCLPTSMSKYNDDVLESLDNKDRIRLFATNECSFNCPKKTCYSMISKMSNNNFSKHDGNIELMNKERDNYFCSMSIKNANNEMRYPRDNWWDDGFIFDINKLNSIGFNRFKIANSV